MKYFSLLFLIFFLCIKSNAQIAWLKDIQNPHANFFVVQKEFNDWKKTHPNKVQLPENGEDISEQYYRWENYWRTRITHDGTLLNETLVSRKTQTASRATGPTANWQPSAYNGISDIDYLGRIDCIAINPVDSNVIWAGSPTGGLWKSTNNGLSWTTNTDTLPRIGISDIVIDPKNTANMYLALGDRDSPYNDGIWSLGVLKSTDSGKTWQTTGLNWQAVQNADVTIRRLLIDPFNDNTLYSAVQFNDSVIVYKTTNAGTTWEEIFGTGASGGGGKVDIALMPGNSSTLYIAFVNSSGNTEVYTSVNGGSIFTPNTLTSNASAVNLRLAVSPANADYVYVLTSNYQDFNSLYLSKNAGNTFNLQCDTPNILGYDCTVSPSFGNGQGYYDLSMNVSTTNADEVFIGGISIWQSSNAGVNWTINSNSCWDYGVHSDQHYTIFSPFHPDVVYEGCDGGIYKSNDLGNTWNCLNANIRTTQFYGSQASTINADEVIGGSQDNGTMIIRDDSLVRVGPGDGARPNYFAPTDNDIYSFVNDGYYIIIDSGNWEFPTQDNYQFNPQNPFSLYVYNDGLYKSYNFGTTWSLVANANPVSGNDYVINFPTGDSSMFFAIMNNNQVYKVNAKTGNATSITADIPDFFAQNFCVSNTDTNKIWITGLAATYSIYYSNNGGATWNDITGSLTNQYFASIVYQNNSNDVVYVSSSSGVYYIDSAQSDWVNWSNGLPNIEVNELSVNYPLNELVGSTYGRGIWETPLYSSSAGIGQIAANHNAVKLFPNPNNGTFTIQLQNINQSTRIQIFNLLGETIYTAPLNSVSTQINLNNHQAGMYLYRISTTDGQLISNGKFVIE